MTRIEFTLATITQELGMLTTTRRAHRDTWLNVAMPSIVRVATLSNMLAEDRTGEQEAALRALSGAVGLLTPPTEAEDAATEPHSSDEAWAAITGAARGLRRAFAGAVEAWVLPD